MAPRPARADVELRMVETMVDCAHALGVGFAEAATAEPDLQRRLKLHAAFLSGFQAVRLGIRLCLTLRAGPAPVRSAQPDADTSDTERVESAEREAAERARGPIQRESAERDRERDDEPVSLSRFLASLRGVAAAALREPDVADLALVGKLNGLLAQTEAPPPKPAPPSAGVALLTRPPPSPAKARLLGSAAPPLTLGGLARPRRPPRPSG